ncbi:unnamed protein product, partial [marine sediment metagenome]
FWMEFEFLLIAIGILDTQIGPFQQDIQFDK